MKSNDINTNHPNTNTVIVNGILLNDITCNLDNESVIKIYGGTNVSSKNITIYFYHGGTTNSFLSIPLSYNHQQLYAFQGGGNSSERYHLTLQQYNNARNIKFIFYKHRIIIKYILVNI